MPARSIGVSIGLIVATLAAGLGVRFAPLGLPAVVVKYGGSGLWALMIYWIVSALATRRIGSAALIAGAVAAGVEVFKLYRSPPLDAFRHTLPGVLLLGRVFSGWDLVAYGLAIAAGAVIDRALRGATNGDRTRNLRHHKPAL